MIITYYILKDPINGEIRYVGRTKNSLEIRLYGHINKQGTLGYKFYWIKKLKSIGLKPIIEEIDSIEIEDTIEDWLYAYKIEKYWISQFITWGFRLTNHNDRGAGYFGKSKGKKKGNKTFMYNLDGVLIATYLSCMEASKLCGIEYKSIQEGIKRNSIIDKKYVFTNSDFIEPIRKNFREIYQYTLDGVLIKKHTNVYIINKLGYKLKSIRSNCNNETKSCYGFIWTYDIFSKKIRKKQDSKNIFQFDINNSFIKKWDSANEVCENNKGYTAHNIRRVCSGNRKSYKGFIWRY